MSDYLPHRAAVRTLIMFGMTLMSELFISVVCVL